MGGMGFKKLNMFNVAFLAKQGWRLLTNENFMASKLLKARYIFLIPVFLRRRLAIIRVSVGVQLWEVKSFLSKGVFVESRMVNQLVFGLIHGFRTHLILMSLLLLARRTLRFLLRCCSYWFYDWCLEWSPTSGVF